MSSNYEQESCVRICRGLARKKSRSVGRPETLASSSAPALLSESSTEISREAGGEGSPDGFGRPTQRWQGRKTPNDALSRPLEEPARPTEAKHHRRPGGRALAAAACGVPHRPKAQPAGPASTASNAGRPIRRLGIRPCCPHHSERPPPAVINRTSSHLGGRRSQRWNAQAGR